MTAAMETTRRGRKHRCGACGAAFYDLDRELSACPKCETPYAAAAQMPRGEAVRKRTRRPEPEAEPKAPAAEAGEADTDGDPILDAADDTESAEEADEGEQADDATEDDNA